jgi:hypothetical protein
VTLPAPWKRRTRKQRGIDRREAKAARAAILAELRGQWNAAYAARMANPKRRATRQAGWRLDRARRKPKPRTEAQRLRRNELARARYIRAKAVAVPLTPEQREAQRAAWRRQKANMSQAQRNTANARRRARRPKKLRARFDRPWIPKRPGVEPSVTV